VDAAVCCAILPDCLAVLTPFTAVVRHRSDSPASVFPVPNDPSYDAAAFTHASQSLFGAIETCLQLKWLQSRLNNMLVVLLAPFYFGITVDCD
jgi:hypothetical protein